MTNFRTTLSVKYLKQRLAYDPSTGDFRWRTVPPRSSAKVGNIAGSRAHKGYWQIHIDGFPYRAHRLAWLYMTGEWPAREIDHKNRIRDDNRFSNLREASSIQNNVNRSLSVKNTSGVKGVSWNGRRRKWCAFIRIDGKNKNLGGFVDKKDAAQAYLDAARKLYGEFCTDGKRSP